MAYCDECGNYDDSHLLECGVEEKSYEERPDYQPDLYYYWDSPLEEDYDWRSARPNVCLLYTSPSPRDKRQSRMPSSA